ncbi:MAG TPA: NAD(P)-binding domain-containing protein [Tepidisphaeraceae bacterium]
MEYIRTDVVVVGAGPIGLELAVALKAAGIEYLHFDARQIGYTISWFPPQTRFFSSNERIAIAGVPLQTPDQTKATREQYLAYLRSIVEQFDLEVQTYTPVVGIQRNDEGFVVSVQQGARRHQVHCRRIVLCTGGTDHPRRLNIPGEDLPHVSHYFQDPHPYFRKRLLVVGGKNSAVETALRCHHAGAYVSLSYRREQLDPKSIKYWLLPEINGLVADGKIGGLFDTLPTAITSNEVVLRPVHAANRANGDDVGNEVRVPADFVLLQIGYEQDTTLFELAGLELRGECRVPAYDERTMETSVPGIYVAGTAVGGTQDKYRLFIENCHVHVDRILAALTGVAPPPTPASLAAPES